MAWTLATPSNGVKPSARHHHNLAYDSQHQVTVLFGGSDINNTLKADTWEWNGATWTLRNVAGPSPRQRHAMACDSQHQVTVLFGGAGLNFLGDTWEWDGVTWTQKSTSGPSARSDAAMAYDPVKKVTVLFGGGDNTGPKNDTWEWNGSTWTQMVPVAQLPPPRAGHGMSSGSDCVVVFGGGNVSSAYLGDTWSWDGIAWALSSSSGPTARTGLGMAYDSARAAIVVFGGFNVNVFPFHFGDTWENGCLDAGLADLEITGVTFDAACNVSFTIVNHGVSPAGPFVFEAGLVDVSGLPQWRQSSPITLAGGGQTTVTWSGVTVYGTTLTVRVDPGDAVIESQEGNNLLTVPVPQACRFVPTACVTPPAAANMVAWWPLDESTGTASADLAGFANNGAQVNGPTAVAGVVGGALSFDGNDDYLEVADHAELQLGTGDFSFDAWVQTSANDMVVLLDKRSVDNQWNPTGYHVYAYQGRLGIQLSDGTANSYTSAAFIADGLWHHIAVTVDRDSHDGIKFYVDGMLQDVADLTVANGSLDNAAPLRLGSGSTGLTGNSPFAGILDEVELFNRVLQPVEVAQIWAAAQFGKCRVPDLEVAAVTFDAACNVSVTIVNHGVSPAGPFVFEAGLVDVSGLPQWRQSSPITLAGGGQTTVTWSGVTIYGTTLTVRVDPGGAVVESQEGNNVLTVPVPQACRFVPTACVTPPAAANMVAWWPLDESTGTTSADSAGFANNGGQVNGPTAVAGMVGGGLGFDGQNDYVEVADHPELNFGTGDWSFDTWVQTSASSGVAMVLLDKRSVDNQGNPTGYHVFAWQGHLGVQLADGTGHNYTSGAFIADGLWHHIAVTVDRDDPQGLSFYVDGMLREVMDPTSASGSLDNVAPLRLGARSFMQSGFFAGLLDEVELFSRVLTAEEVTQIWAAAQFGKCRMPDLVVASVVFDEDCAVSITITNAGFADAVGNFEFTAQLVEHPQGSGQPQQVGVGAINGLAAHSSITFQWLNVKVFGGTIQISVDPLNQIGEANEANNVLTAAVPEACRFVPTACVPPPAAASMVAWWPLDEVTGTTSADLAGFANNGGHVNGPTAVAGMVAGALRFDGQNDYVEVADHPELNFGTGDWSFDAWIQTSGSTGLMPLLDKRAWGNQNAITGYHVYCSEGRLGVQLADGTHHNYSSGAFIADGLWHHIGVTVDRDNPQGLRFYVDGMLRDVMNPTSASGSLDNSAPMRLGAFFTGILDEVELFDRVLMRVEVAQIWAAAQFGKCKEPPIACAGETTRTLFSAGQEDSFATADGKEKSQPSTDLLAWHGSLNAPPPVTEFDFLQPDFQFFLHSFTQLNAEGCSIIGAAIKVSLMAVTSAAAGGPGDDVIGFVQGNSVVWQQPIASLTANGQWALNQQATLSLDLSSLPGTPQSILGTLSDGQLDLFIGDNTAVDFVSLSLVRCCDEGTCVAPVVLSAPQNFNRTTTSTVGAVFPVTVGGSQPMSCQWFYEGTPLSDGDRNGRVSGAATHTLTLAPPFELSDTGFYSLICNNACGTVSTGAILKVSVQLTGGDHAPLGEARLALEGEKLLVSNLKRLEEDGVSIALSELARGITVLFEPLELAQPGSAIQARTLGQLNGIPGQPLAGATLRNRDGIIELSADFEPLGSSQVEVQVWNDAQQSGSAQVTGDGVIATTTGGAEGLPRLVSLSWDNRGGSDSGTSPGFIFGFDREVMFTLANDFRFSGKVIRLLAANAIRKSDGLETLNLTASLPSSFVIIAEEIRYDQSRPPVIVQHPQSLTAIEGEAVAFAVEAAGSLPLHYTWNHNGQPIESPFASGPNLFITNVLSVNAGSYFVVVSNAAGVVTSQVAQLTVLNGPIPEAIRLDISKEEDRLLLDVLVNRATVGFWELQSRDSLAEGEWMSETNGFGSLQIQLTASGPTKFYQARGTAGFSIISQPAEQTVLEGGTAEFRVAASNVIGYQWYKNEFEIPGATQPQLSLTGIQLQDEADYTVILQGVNATAMTLPATLKVNALSFCNPGFNVDFCNGSLWTPNTFGGAANQPGFWNQATGYKGPKYLDNLSGQATDVHLIAPGDLGPCFSFNNPNTSGSIQTLMDDLSSLGASNAKRTLNVRGLPAGTYQVYTYAWDPTSSSASVSVNVNNAGAQQVGGAWPGSFVQGVTHALHTVTIGAGQDIVIDFHVLQSGAILHEGALNGLQIVPINVPLLANAGPDRTICLGHSVTLQATGGNHYTWSPGGQTTSQITVSPATTTTYTVTVSCDNGGSATDQVTVFCLS